MSRLKVMSVFGTRPEAIKMAPLVLELERRPQLESVVCVTAQHREMLDSVLREFGITPEHDLNIMKAARASQTSPPGCPWPGVRGGAPSSSSSTGTRPPPSPLPRRFYARIPVGHVEAGLRTFDRWSPWPEEMNRRLTGQIASFHFAPTARNAENLRREGVEGSIWITGNTVIDALRYTASGEGFTSPELADIDYVNHRVVTLTCHRRENYGKPMRNIFEAVRNTALRFPDVIFVYPVHLSPVVREAAGGLLSGRPTCGL
ncbi:MAG: UDP-N-acetyl glucosamine 2-epimerase [Oscillospiraceae bacterium]